MIEVPSPKPAPAVTAPRDIEAEVLAYLVNARLHSGSSEYPSTLAGSSSLSCIAGAVQCTVQVTLAALDALREVMPPRVMLVPAVATGIYPPPTEPYFRATGTGVRHVRNGWHWSRES